MNFVTPFVYIRACLPTPTNPKGNLKIWIKTFNFHIKDNIEFQRKFQMSLYFFIIKLFFLGLHSRKFLITFLQGINE